MLRVQYSELLISTENNIKLLLVKTASGVGHGTGIEKAHASKAGEIDILKSYIYIFVNELIDRILTSIASAFKCNLNPRHF